MSANNCLLNFEMPLPPNTVESDWTNFWTRYAEEESEGRRFTILLEGTDEEEALLESLKTVPAGEWMDVVCFVFPRSRRIGDATTVSTPEGELPILWDAGGLPYVLGPGRRRGEVTVPVKMMYAALLHPLLNGSVGFYLGTQWIEVADTGIHDAVQARNKAYGIGGTPDAAKRTYVRPEEPKKPSRVSQPRRGERLNAEMMHRIFRAPTDRSHIAAINLLNGPFQRNPNGPGIISQNLKRHMSLMIDPEPIGPIDFAVSWLSRKGPSVIQTLYALIGLWLEKKHKFGRPWNEYLEIRTSDLLRYKGRREVGTGGYHAEDLRSCGTDIAVLMSAKPYGRVTEIVTKGPRKTSSGRRIGTSKDRLALIDIKPLERYEAKDADGPKPVLALQYHLSQEVYEGLVGASPQFVHVPQQLLMYNPRRERYHVLLGFALSYHQRTMKKFGANKLKISLIAALNRAEIALPATHLDRFLEAIQRAVAVLNSDGVIPGAKLLLPAASAEVTPRRQLMAALIEMDPAPIRMDPLRAELVEFPAS